MAEASSNLLVTPEIAKPRGNSGRSSTEKASSSSSGEKVLPHYLRASTGSCHDFCKYGRKHAFEAAARHSVRKRITKPIADNETPTASMVLPETEKTLLVRPKSSPISESCSSDIPEIIKREVSTRSLDGRNASTISLDGQNLVNSEVLSGIKKKSASKLRPSPNSKTNLSESPKFKGQEQSSSSAKLEASSKSGSKLRPLLNSKTNLSESPKFKRQEQSSYSPKLEASSKLVPPNPKGTDKSAKPATALKPKSRVQKPLSSNDPSGGLSGRRNSDINTGKKTEPPKIAVKKILASPRASLSPTPSVSRVAKKVMATPRVSLVSPVASLSPKPSLSRVASLNPRKLKSLKVVSPMKNQDKTKKTEPQEPKIELKHANNDLAQEKTLYVIKTEPENRSVESDQNESSVVESSPPPSSSLPKSLPASTSSSLNNEEDQEKSEYTETATEEGSLSESEYDETMSLEEEENMGGEHPGRPRKDMFHSEDEHSQEMKLRFRRGRVLDIQSDNSSPRRLKFRRGRVLGENPNLKAGGRRSFKKRGMDGEMMNDSKPGSQKVVLRHQDVQGKKDSQILFNNVIEQTASKLVETRKSKVKALVGAFETVISLQETRPPANTVT